MVVAENTSIPRTTEGKPDLTAKAPRTADGKPDLSGLWMLPDETYWHDIGANLGPKGVPLQPWAAALYKERRDNEGRESPIARCMPAGVPTIDNIPTPFKLIQTFLYEYNMGIAKSSPMAAPFRETPTRTCGEGNRGMEHMVGKEIGTLTTCANDPKSLGTREVRRRDCG
jgi:hypothetical protein